MAVVTGSNSGFGNGDATDFSKLLNSVALGTPTSTTWSSTFSNSQWDFVGTGFGSVQGGFPTVGTITSLNYLVGGVLQLSITSLSLDMVTFYQFLAAGNSQALLSFIFASDDTFTGGDGNDNFDGYGGNDQFTGGAGNDRILGGDGNDTASGGSGNDDLNGGSGTNVLNGDGGNDTISGSGVGDTLVDRI